MNNVFNHNFAGEQGGALSLYNSHSQVSNLNAFNNNTAWLGGAIA
jgi:hypothetical protein